MENKTKVNKREESTKKYIDRLQENYSKLSIVRVDLGYKKDERGKVNTSLEQANKDLTKMKNNKRGKPSIFNYQVGQMSLKEEGKDKGVHFHAVFIFDGNKVQKDAYMGDKIGEYWKEITKDRGSYYNCNRKKYKHKGVGMLHHTDTEKREILDKYVLSYLCKDDEEQNDNTNNRAFTRGTMPKSKGDIGRPRNK